LDEDRRPKAVAARFEAGRAALAPDGGATAPRGFGKRPTVRRRVHALFDRKAVRRLSSTAREQYKPWVTGGYSAQPGSEQAERLLR